MLPAERSDSTPCKLATSSAARSSTHRPMMPRTSTTDGAAAREAASRAPKSVSALTEIRSSRAACRTTSSHAACSPTTRQVTVQRVEQVTDRVHYRRSRKRKRLLAHNRELHHRQRRSRRSLSTREVPEPLRGLAGCAPSRQQTTF